MRTTFLLGLTITLVILGSSSLAFAATATSDNIDINFDRDNKQFVIDYSFTTNNDCGVRGYVVQLNEVGSPVGGYFNFPKNHQFTETPVIVGKDGTYSLPVTNLGDVEKVPCAGQLTIPTSSIPSEYFYSQLYFVELRDGNDIWNNSKVYDYMLHSVYFEYGNPNLAGDITPECETRTYRSIDIFVTSKATTKATYPCNIEVTNVPTVTPPITSTNNTKSSGCYDCESPTLEFLEINGTSDWLAQNNNTMKITEMQRLKFAYSDNLGPDNIDQIKIGFGLPSKYSHISNAEAIIDLRIDNGVFESLTVTDENNLLMVIDNALHFSKIQCGNKECLQGILDFGWAEKPAHGYAVILASDKRGNTDIERLGEIIVIGETINKQPTELIYNRSTSSMKDGLFINITRTDKVSDMWIDEKDRYWQGFGNDRFEIIPSTLAAFLNNH